MKYDDRLLDSISAITNFFCNIGEVAGPLVAGFISEEIGFSNGLSLIGIFSLAFLSFIFRFYLGVIGKLLELFLLLITLIVKYLLGKTKL